VESGSNRPAKAAKATPKNDCPAAPNLGRGFARPVGAVRAGENGVFQKSNLLKRINVIWVVQSHLKKYSASWFAQITFRTHAVSSHSRGVSRSSRTRDGMRWTLIVPLTNGAKADGEVVWS
jgi:hypothetical protein